VIKSATDNRGLAWFRRAPTVAPEARLPRWVFPGNIQDLEEN
jgi:hypothetical protein